MGGEGIAPIRGLPEDANPITRLAWEDFGTDSTTWYSHSEIGQLLRLHWPASPGREAEIMKHFGPAPLWCLGWDRRLEADVEDLRWVFWFA